jgi:hypothetical protein
MLDATVDGFARGIGNLLFHSSEQADQVALGSFRHSHRRPDFAADSALGH